MFKLDSFSVQRPRYQIAQGQALGWLAGIHAAAQATLESQNASTRDAFAERLRKLIDRCACGPTQIGSRGHVTPDLGTLDWQSSHLYDVTRHPHGLGTAARSRLFAEIVDGYFEREFAEDNEAPSELIHVTCTGYVAPSGAQRLVASKGWGDRTQVTHAYHMGCYAAFPAIRMAAGALSLPVPLGSNSSTRRVDIAHTELCTLHLDPSQHSAEQLVVQSLFGDGFVRYSVRADDARPGLEVLALSEQILEDSAASMGWTSGDFGMTMTLARDVPDRISSALRSFVLQLFEKSGMNAATELRSAVVAVHPGGPKVIDRVRDVLELNEAQVASSRGVLFDYGNMSSATLPHVWMRILADAEIAVGTPILSLAFGPGLTVCGGLFRKR
ncbi:MAG: 3-oxoacyl-[acyl-carrier-protein] synthase III C-terminal domain-containing protein [Polyangiaceae bacterium]